MEELLGKVEFQAHVISGDREGNLTIYEKGIIYDVGDKNGRVVSPYNYIESIASGRELPLGKVEANIVTYSLLGERFNLQFAVSEAYFHELMARWKGRERGR